MIGPCICGDTECPSCGAAQGTLGADDFSAAECPGCSVLQRTRGDEWERPRCLHCGHELREETPDDVVHCLHCEAHADGRYPRPCPAHPRAASPEFDTFDSGHDPPRPDCFDTGRGGPHKWGTLQDGEPVCEDCGAPRGRQSGPGPPEPDLLQGASVCAVRLDLGKGTAIRVELFPADEPYWFASVDGTPPGAISTSSPSGAVRSFVGELRRIADAIELHDLRQLDQAAGVEPEQEPPAPLSISDLPWGKPRTERDP